MSGLSKRAPFHVRFPLHYNYMYKRCILQWRAWQNGHHLMSVLIFTTTTTVEFCNNVGLVKTGTIWCPFSFTLQLQKSGLSKRAPFDVRFDVHNYKRSILQWRAWQNEHHLMSVLLYTTTTKVEFCNNGGLVKTDTIWCPFCYNYKSRILQ